MPEIRQTSLPGVGVRHELTTRSGQRVGVVSHRTGRRDLLLYAAADPDAAAASVALTADESATLAEVLGGTQLTASLADLQHIIEGLALDWVPVPPGSPFAGRSIAAAGVRSTTGVSIVAVLRPGTTGGAKGPAHAFPAPRPDFVLRAGDTVVVVGTPEGIEALVELLET
ncbi:MAG: potassium transporter TrkA [Actinomycetota bacterium]|jgi:TrkA domain protein|nr:potassium transporter TrkA [Actinomycetota bacterium]